ncbi:MFS domain-containing protein [Favolaschia claudopus]|uniref:MFS domain-containing protein n=1 Tax=Favolaschia claudopus TaxID=2862362 RepID=A0AAW0CAZ7_9AGAR
MAAPPTTLPNVSLSFGPMLIGVFINMTLFQYILTHLSSKVLTYFTAYRQLRLYLDAGWMKVFVFSLFVIETANTAFDMAIMFQPLITHYGQPPKFFPTFWALTKSMWIPIIVVILAIASLAGGVWTAAMIAIVKTFANKPKLHNSALLWFLSSCVADILITISLVFTLAKRKSGFSSSTDGDFVWDLALSKLYTNCLMSTLNARQSLNSQSASGGISDQRRNASHGLVMNQSARPRQPETFVDNTRHMDSSAIYELDAQKSVYDVEAGFAPAREEYGIQVTKVIERVKDPLPYETAAPHPYTQ